MWGIRWYNFYTNYEPEYDKDENANGPVYYLDDAYDKIYEYKKVRDCYHLSGKYPQEKLQLLFENMEYVKREDVR